MLKFSLGYTRSVVNLSGEDNNLLDIKSLWLSIVLA